MVSLCHSIHIKHQRQFGQICVKGNFALNLQKSAGNLTPSFLNAARPVCTDICTKCQTGRTLRLPLAFAIPSTGSLGPTMQIWLLGVSLLLVTVSMATPSQGNRKTLWRIQNPSSDHLHTWGKIDACNTQTHTHTHTHTHIS